MLYLALYTTWVPSLTEEIRAAEILNSIYAFKRKQDETPTNFSPCIQSSDDIIYG